MKPTVVIGLGLGAKLEFFEIDPPFYSSIVLWHNNERITDTSIHPDDASFITSGLTYDEFVKAMENLINKTNCVHWKKFLSKTQEYSENK